MLSASLPSVEAEAEAYEAFNLSPMTVVALVLASRRTSVSRISSASASAVFASSNARCGSRCLARANMRSAPRCAARGHRGRPSRPNRPARRGRKARPLARLRQSLQAPCEKHDRPCFGQGVDEAGTAKPRPIVG